MKKYIYKGSTPDNHMRIVALGCKFGLQHIRKMSMGNKIAEMASNGDARAIKACEEHPEFFDCE